MNRGTWPAILLIVAGVLLILHQMDIFYFTWSDIITYGMIGLGLLLFIKGTAHPQKRGILGGTFFITYGAVLLAMRLDYLTRDDQFGFALLFLSIAFANLVYFIFQPQHKGNLIVMVIFALIGTAGIFDYFNIYSGWYMIFDFVRFWPVLLIVLGISIIWKAYRRKSDYLRA